MRSSTPPTVSSRRYDRIQPRSRALGRLTTSCVGCITLRAYLRRCGDGVLVLAAAFGIEARGDQIHHRGISERGGVAEITMLGDIAQ